MKDYKKMLNIITIGIILTCLVSALSIWISNWQGLININYKLSEFFSFILGCGIILLPLELFCFLYYVLKLYKLKKSFEAHTFRLKYNIISAIVFVILFVGLIYLNMNGTTVTGHEPSINKYTDNGEFYVILQGNNYEVSETEYNIICNNTPYLFTIRTKEIFGKTHNKVVFLKSTADDKCW